MTDNEKFQQFGAELRLTEEQAKGLAERLPQMERSGALQITDIQPLCMAKRIEEMEAQVRVIAGLLRESRPYMDHRGGAGVKGYTQLAKEIDTVLSGKLPASVAPEGWQLVPVEPTDRMTRVGQSMRYDSEISIASIYRAMLAAAPKPDPKP